jgi:serine protease Do
MAELPKLVAITPPGTQSKVRFISNGSEKTAEIKLGELPEEVAKASSGSEQGIERNMGLVVQEINPQIQRRLQLEDSKGVIITNVQPGSISWDAGLRRGDIILEVNRKQISSLDEYRKAIDTIKKGESALLLVKRDKNTVYVALKIEGENDKG